MYLPQYMCKGRVVRNCQKVGIMNLPHYMCSGRVVRNCTIVFTTRMGYNLHSDKNGVLTGLLGSLLSTIESHYTTLHYILKAQCKIAVTPVH